VAFDQAIKDGVGVKPVGEVNPQAGRCRVVGPEREERLRDRDQAEADNGENDQCPFQRTRRRRGGQVPAMIQSAPVCKAK
jgi:hypothetical protein